MIEFVVISFVALFAVLFYIGARHERKHGAKSGGFALLACVSLMLGGCATQAPTLDFTPPDIVPSQTKVDADVKTITVSIAKENERLGETQVGFFGNVYEQSFKTALQDALEEVIARTAIFNDLSERKISLIAKVMKFQTPGAGINFKTEAIIRYELVDRNSGATIFKKDITSTGSVPGNYAFLGSIRYTEARNISVRDSITQFILALETSDLVAVSDLESNGIAQ